MNGDNNFKDWFLRVTSGVALALLLWAGWTIRTVSIDVAVIKNDMKQIRDNEFPHVYELIEGLDQRQRRLESVFRFDEEP